MIRAEKDWDYKTLNTVGMEEGSGLIGDLGRVPSSFPFGRDDTNLYFRFGEYRGSNRQEFFGGAEGIRTLDLLDAIEARSQLRHGPTELENFKNFSIQATQRQTHRETSVFPNKDTSNLGVLYGCFDSTGGVP